MSNEMSPELSQFLAAEADASTPPIIESIQKLSDPQLAALHGIVRAEHEKRSAPPVSQMSDVEFNQLKSRYL